ncbi:hypothetical protein A1Q2_00627 [Trichosporon asahii var. asahii CBS 8904]|uniref:F-box domain-containing protein n=1 Tax=Trichosporon asahii var. asahii (strain CBS 8904) TaxID=1220162 RepID=K1W8D1_TRIAC|nr:hypothetical protein A1Q2_00627 [Trichosporon asahii var. asahii CBS 8904]
MGDTRSPVPSSSPAPSPWKHACGHASLAEPSGPPLSTTDADAGSSTPSTSSSGVAPVLDHSCFPHIVDDILLFSSHNTRLSFRATSRAFKSLVDRLYSERVVANDAGLFTPSGRLIPFLSPFSSPSSTPPSTPTSPYRPEHPEQPVIRRLDVMCEWALPAVEAALARLTLDTVHVHGQCRSVHVECDTLVLHAALELTGPRVRTLVLDIDAPKGFTYFVKRPSIPADNTFVVVHPDVELLLDCDGEVTQLSHEEWAFLENCRSL